MYTIRVYFEVLGGHTHMHIRVGKTGCTLGGAGDIVMTNEEFEAWRMGKARVEFVEKETI